MNRGVEPQRGKEKDGGKGKGDERRKDTGGNAWRKRAERHPVTKKGGRVSEAQSPGACRSLAGNEGCPRCDSRSAGRGEKEAACWVGDSEPVEERVSGSGQESNK